MNKFEIASISLPVSASISKHLQSNCQEMKGNDYGTQEFYIRYGAALVCNLLHRRPSVYGCQHKTDIYDVP